MNGRDPLLTISGQDLTAPDVVRVARPTAAGRPLVVLDEGTRVRLREIRERIEADWLQGGSGRLDRPVYGFNTGVGALKGIEVPVGRLREFQRHYIRSHCVGVGSDFPDDVVRGAILLRANSLAAGFSGVRPELVEALLDLLNRGIVPAVPEKGSLGASGDLAPLAHVGSVLLGEPEARVRWMGKETTVAHLVEDLPDWKPIELEAKEGMALTSGTSFMLALAVLLLADAARCVATADLAGALSLEAMQGEAGAFDGRLHSLRPHPGQQASAANIRDLIEGSGFLGRQPTGEPRVQDAYSLRCIPQVHGASRDALSYLAEVVERELNAVTDNPLVFPEGDRFRAVSGGNFHGQPLALALDLAGIALAELGSIAERRLFRILTTSLSYGLAANLTGGQPGLNTGYMMIQYTAAALVAENRQLCQPASADPIPTSGDQEDHVSMGLHAGMKARSILSNLEVILALESIAACQGIDLARNRIATAPPLGRGTTVAHRVVREAGIAPLGEDRYLKPEIDRAVALVRDGRLLSGLEDAGINLRGWGAESKNRPGEGPR